MPEPRIFIHSFAAVALVLGMAVTATGCGASETALAKLAGRLGMTVEDTRGMLKNLKPGDSTEEAANAWLRYQASEKEAATQVCYLAAKFASENAPSDAELYDFVRNSNQLPSTATSDDLNSKLSSYLSSQPPNRFAAKLAIALAKPKLCG